MMRFVVRLLLCSSCIWGQLEAAAANLNSSDPIGQTFALPEMKYYVVQLKATQERASSVCKTFGTELVSIPDAKTNDLIGNLILISGERYWTSGRKLPSGKWVWWYQLATDYTNWGIGQPSSSDKNQLCLQILPSGEWNDRPCDTEYFFICEGPKATSNSVS